VIVVIGYLWRRFFRLRMWIPGLLVPLLLFLLAHLGSEGSPRLARKVLLDYLLYVLPALAILFILGSADRSRWGLMMASPLGFTRLLAGICLGGLLPHAACHLGLVAIAWGAAAWSGDPGGAVFEYHSQVRFWRGGPAAPQLRLGLDAQGKIEWLEDSSPWTFEVRGVPPDASAPEPLPAYWIAEVGRPVVERDAAGAASYRIYEARAAPARVRFQDAEGRDRCPPRSIELLDGRPVPMAVPRAAVLPDGRILAVIEADPTRARPPERGPPGDHAHGPEAETDGHEVFWFDRVLDRNHLPDAEGKFTPSRGRGGAPAAGLLVVRRSHSAAATLWRLGFLLLGLLPLVAAMATFSSAVFGIAVAFAFNLTVTACGLTMGFLREVVQSLSMYSTAVLLGGPGNPQFLRKPGVFDRALEALLKFWLAVLPDFRRFEAAPFFVREELVAWSEVGIAAGVGLAYALSFLLLCRALLWRWEAGR
jgi:hypothetical protein